MEMFLTEFENSRHFLPCDLAPRKAREFSNHVKNRAHQKCRKKGETKAKSVDHCVPLLESQYFSYSTVMVSLFSSFIYHSFQAQKRHFSAFSSFSDELLT